MTKLFFYPVSDNPASAFGNPDTETLEAVAMHGVHMFSILGFHDGSEMTYFFVRSVINPGSDSKPLSHNASNFYKTFGEACIAANRCLYILLDAKKSCNLEYVSISPMVARNPRYGQMQDYYITMQGAEFGRVRATLATYNGIIITETAASLEDACLWVKQTAVKFDDLRI